MNSVLFFTATQMTRCSSVVIKVILITFRRMLRLKLIKRLKRLSTRLTNQAKNCSKLILINFTQFQNACLKKKKSTVTSLKQLWRKSLNLKALQKTILWIKTENKYKFTVVRKYYAPPFFSQN